MRLAYINAGSLGGIVISVYCYYDYYSAVISPGEVYRLVVAAVRLGGGGKGEGVDFRRFCLYLLFLLLFPALFIDIISFFSGVFVQFSHPRTKELLTSFTRSRYLLTVF